MSITSLDDLLAKRHLFAGVTDDSRSVSKNFIFVAIPGTRRDGTTFIDEAVGAGATAIVGEMARDQGPVPYFQVADARTALALLASEFSGHPSRDLSVVGITGTCGKTTVSYLVESILAASGRRPGVIGSIGYRYGDVSFSAPLTTPGAERLQSLLKGMVSARCDSVVMEVTSHSLQQARVKGIAFDVVAFTNLSIDHLDFHANMEDYFLAKAALFGEYVDDARAQGKNPVAVVNVGDEYGRRLVDIMRRSPAPPPIIPFSVEGSVELNGSHVTSSAYGSSGSVGDVKLETRLAGRFNVENILTAIAIGKALGLRPAEMAAGISALRRVPGRLDLVSESSQGVAVFVDHAHKPGALEVVLTTLRELTTAGKLIVVFGCGGDRDKTKRPIMGRIAQKLADEVWITSDNPRTEEPEDIIRDILAGVSRGDAVHVEVDRRRAIQDAIQGARAGDVVVIAGKGHETYQILRDPGSPGKTRTIDFDDRVEALNALRAAGQG